jgi:hypothetical protein
MGTPASERIAERLGSPNLTSIPPAGVSDRFSQRVGIVKDDVNPKKRLEKHVFSAGYGWSE